MITSGHIFPTEEDRVLVDAVNSGLLDKVKPELDSKWMPYNEYVQYREYMDKLEADWVKDNASGIVKTLRKIYEAND